MLCTHSAMKIPAMRTPIKFFILLLCLLPLAALADSQPLTYDRIRFNESASFDVENDTLVAIMYVQREGRRAQDLARAVNRVMSSALDQLKGIPEIKTQTQAYHTSAVYKKSEITGWRVRQSVRLESRDSKLLGDTIGELQQILNVQSISYQVSDQLRRRHHDELIDTALQRFQQRAQRIARTMGRPGYRVVAIQVRDSGSPRPVAMRMERLSSSMAAAPAQIEAGTQRIEVTVSGEIELED